MDEWMQANGFQFVYWGREFATCNYCGGVYRSIEPGLIFLKAHIPGCYARPSGKRREV